MNKIQRIQKFFHTDKWWGRVVFIVSLYILFILVWFNFLMPHIFDGYKVLFNFEEFGIFYSVSLLFSIFQVFSYPAAIFDPLLYFFSIIPILGFLFVNKFIFKVFQIKSKIIKFLYYICSLIFIFIMLRFLIFAIFSNIHPNFF